MRASFLTSNDDRNKIDPTSCCLAYTQYLDRQVAATASLEEAVAAVLPCFWIYREVGLNIAARAQTITLIGDGSLLTQVRPFLLPPIMPSLY